MYKDVLYCSLSRVRLASEQNYENKQKMAQTFKSLCISAPRNAGGLGVAACQAEDTGAKGL